MSEKEAIFAGGGAVHTPTGSLLTATTWLHLARLARVRAHARSLALALSDPTGWTYQSIFSNTCYTAAQIAAIQSLATGIIM